MPYSLLKRLYLRIPLTPRQRFRIGQFKRRLLRQPPVRVAELTTAVVSSPPSGPTCIVPGAAGVRDYYFFGVIDWHFRHQRPQQLALALARGGRRVFYISTNFVDHGEAGFALERLDPALALYQVGLHVRGPLSVYAEVPGDAQLRQLQSGLRHLWEQAGTASAVHLVQHPFWYRLASFVAPARTVYDCMDFHAGFSNTAKAHDDLEQRMLESADLCIVTSDFLADYAARAARHVETIRNAAEFAHFHQAWSARPGPAGPRPVIGYYGAIAEWFDVDLLAAVAERFAHCDIELVGADTVEVGHQLKRFANVRLRGEQPYAELPGWLARFDVCLIPFRVLPLTLATNPVKVYEYLSAGKPVVAVDLPELQQFGDLVYRATDTGCFLDQLQRALDEGTQPAALTLRQRRVDFVRTQTWEARAQRLAEVAEDAGDEPRISVVVVSYNHWHLTARCLESLQQRSDCPHLEVIVVDNASADHTAEGLRAWAAQDPAHRQALINSENRGFAAAVNQGLARAQGEFLVVLNNDTIVSPGWARGLRRHLQAHPTLGLLCPITNNIGNEAQVALPGETPEQVFAAARHYTLGRAGQLLPLGVAAFFCVMLPRKVYQTVGPMDEQFFPGFFEDDDYCLRVRQAGWSIGCAEDVFVYHELSATFSAEGAARRQAIFERNQRLFEAKWGPWKPHVYRSESLPPP